MANPGRGQRAERAASPHRRDLFSGARVETIDGHSIQPYYTNLLARDCGMTIEAVTGPELVTLIAARAASWSESGEKLPSRLPG